MKMIIKNMGKGEKKGKSKSEWEMGKRGWKGKKETCFHKICVFIYFLKIIIMYESPQSLAFIAQKI